MLLLSRTLSNLALTVYYNGLKVEKKLRGKQMEIKEKHSHLKKMSNSPKKLSTEVEVKHFDRGSNIYF